MDKQRSILFIVVLVGTMVRTMQAVLASDALSPAAAITCSAGLVLLGVGALGVGPGWSREVSTFWGGLLFGTPLVGAQIARVPDLAGTPGMMIGLGIALLAE